MQRSYMERIVALTDHNIKKFEIIVIVILSYFFFLTDTVFALPTPDALVNAFQVIPIIMSLLIGLFTGLGIYLKKHISKFHN